MKGSRNYVRGADVCRIIQDKVISEHPSDQFKRFAIKFSKLTANVTSMTTSLEKVKPSDKTVASGSVRFRDQTIHLLLEDSGKPTEERLESSEKFIFDPIKINDNTLEIDDSGICIEAIIAKTKQLHTKLFPPGDSKSWIFVALDVCRPLEPKELKGLRITYKADRGAITESLLENEFGTLGTVFFSLADKSDL